MTIEPFERLRLFELAFERTPALIAYVDHRRRFRFASQAYCDRHGLRREEIDGRPVSEVLGEETFSRLAPFVDSALRGEEQGFETMITGPTGETRWVNASYIPDRGEDGSVCGFFAFVRDVNQRKAVEESRDRFRYAVDQGMEGFALHDKDGSFSYINPAQAEMYGYHPEEVIGNSWRMFYEDAVAEEIATVHFPMLMSEGAWHGELVGRKKDGAAFDVEVALTVLKDDQGEYAGLVCNCRDITERKLAEASLRQLHKIEALGQLTGGIAHDFNNLLTVILGNLDLLRRQTPGDALVEHAREAVQRGAMLTRRLLTFSRKQPLRPRALHLDELLEGMDDLMRRTLGERIEVRIVNGTGLWLCDADPSVLENVVLNLAVNARDAMPKGGTLTFETANAGADEMAETSIASAGDFVRLTVADTGVGMSDEVRRQIFDPFFTTKGPGRGSGLGLSMAHDFVQQSGGHIKLESRVGEGTTFKLYLPRSRAAERAMAPAASATIPSGGQEVVLVVEDDPNVRRLVVSMLDDLGYRAVAAENATDGLHQFFAQQADLLLTDVVLPGDLDGLELASRVWLRRPRARILFMSGYNEQLHLDQAPADHEIHLLPKPFTRQELAQTVRRLLETS